LAKGNVKGNKRLAIVPHSEHPNLLIISTHLRTTTMRPIKDGELDLRWIWLAFGGFRHFLRVHHARTRMAVHIGTNVIHETSDDHNPWTVSGTLLGMHVQVTKWYLESTQLLSLKPRNELVHIHRRKVREVRRTGFLIQAMWESLFIGLQKPNIRWRRDRRHIRKKQKQEKRNSKKQGGS
jgi:hypothetical protein